MSDLKKLLDSEAGKKLSANKEGIQKIASGSDGQKVMGIFKDENVEEALKSGDTDAVRSAIEKAAKTEEGARLFRELSKLLNV